jgi:hypothetical protein
LATCRERRRAAHRLFRKQSGFLEEGVEKPVVIVRCAGPGWQELSSGGTDFGGERALRSRCVAVVQDKCVDLTLVLSAKDRTRCVEQLAV